MIWITSDTHFFHDREFIWKPRGFNSCQEMNQCYRKQLVNLEPEDELYILGDFCLGTDYLSIYQLFSCIKSKLHLIIGNHDTDNKVIYYKAHEIDVKYADMITYKKRRFYLSHYPTEVSSLESDPKTCIINLSGHTHSKDKFYMDKPYIYNVSVDANSNKLITLDDVLEEFNKKVRECKRYLDE